jgi:hypothetical protein
MRNQSVSSSAWCVGPHRCGPWDPPTPRSWRAGRKRAPESERSWRSYHAVSDSKEARFSTWDFDSDRCCVARHGCMYHRTASEELGAGQFCIHSRLHVRASPAFDDRSSPEDGQR